jgi:hypothetical protein
LGHRYDAAVVPIAPATRNTANIATPRTVANVEPVLSEIDLNTNPRPIPPAETAVAGIAAHVSAWP